MNGFKLALKQEYSANHTQFSSAIKTITDSVISTLLIVPCMFQFWVLIPCFLLLSFSNRFKIKYHPEEAIKRKEEQMAALKVIITCTKPACICSHQQCLLESLRFVFAE